MEDSHFWLLNLLQNHSNETVWYWHKNRHIDQWNRIDGLEINPNIYHQLIFSKDGKAIQWGKRQVSSTDDVGTTEHPHEWGWNFTLYNIQKVTGKWIKDLNVRAKTTQFLEENIGKHFHDMGFAMISWYDTERTGNDKKSCRGNQFYLHTYIKWTYNKCKSNTVNGNIFCLASTSKCKLNSGS